MPLQGIKKQNIGDMVFEQLRSAIASGEWQCGDKLPSESELCNTLGVSRVSVRSALQKLSGLGLVESRRGEGTFVCNSNGSQCMNSIIPIIALNGKDRKSMAEFRFIVETESAALAAMRATSEQIAQMRSATRKMAESSGHKAAEMDLAFHKLIAEATHNPIIIKVFEILNDYYLSLFVTNISVMGSKGSKQHQLLTDAIASHDSVLARDIMKTHLEASTRETENLDK